jgi:hypothetical protein
MSFPLAGNPSENKKDCGQAAMTKSVGDVIMLFNCPTIFLFFPSPLNIHFRKPHE